MKRKVRGSFTIEAAVIVPVILFVFVILLNILFYYHDKNLLEAAAHETAAYASTLEKADESEIQSHFYSRIREKTLLFSQMEMEAKIEDRQVDIVCSAKKSLLSLKVAYTMSRTHPENYIRNIRKIEKIGEGIGK